MFFGTNAMLVFFGGALLLSHVSYTDVGERHTYKKPHKIHFGKDCAIMSHFIYIHTVEVEEKSARESTKW